MVCITDGEGWPTQYFRGQQVFERTRSERRFGVELEFNELPDDVYDLEQSTIFGAKEDVTVGGGEFNSPILFGDDGLTICEDFCDNATRMGFVAGRKTGFHLHCDMREESVCSFKNTVLAYHYTYPFWKGTVSNLRRVNDTCAQHRYNADDIQGAPNGIEEYKDWAANWTRYTWINIDSWDWHGSLEIRLHEGTSDKKDVINWILAHLRFIDVVSVLSSGQITRMFGDGKSPNLIFRELRAILADQVVSQHLANRYVCHN